MREQLTLSGWSNRTVDSLLGRWGCSMETSNQWIRVRIWPARIH